MSVDDFEGCPTSIFFVNSTTRPRNRSWIPSWISSRVVAPQAWPALRNIPKTAARAAASTSASSKIRYGALPPSSRLIRFTSSPACAPIILPVPVSPVKEILSTFLRSEEHTSELQSPDHIVCRLLLEKQ